MQFTDLNKRDQLAKLTEARASSIDQPLKKFKFVSSMNEQVPFLTPLERIVCFGATAFLAQSI